MSVGFFEDDAQLCVASLCEFINLVVAEPSVGLVAKSVLVFSPALEEVHGVACALLDYNITVLASDINLHAGNRGWTSVSLFAFGVHDRFAEHHPRLFE